MTSRAARILLPLASISGCLLTNSLDGYTGGVKGDGGVQDTSAGDEAAETSPTSESPCKTPDAKRYFCADFDGVSILEGWGKLIPGTPSISFATDVFVSPPHAATFQLGAGSLSYQLLLANVPTHGANALTFAASAYVDAATFSEVGRTLPVSLSHLQNANSVGVRFGASGVELVSQRGGPFVVYGPVDAGLLPRKWARFSVRLQETPPSFELRVDDRLVLSDTLPSVPAVDVVELRAGIGQADDPKPTARLLIDNVTVTAD